MFLRVDKLQIELPAPKKQDPNAAAALQELLGGKYGEMSTLGNYLFQSFNFRSKSKLRPFYSLVAAITAEEIGHVELVSNGVAMLANGPDKPDGDAGDGGDISGAPYEAMKDVRLAGAFFSHAGGAVPVNSNAMSWNADMVTTTGNVIVDLLHNFHLECGARLHKLRVYETLTDPTGTRGLRLPAGPWLGACACLRPGVEEAHRGGAREVSSHAEHSPGPHSGVPEVSGVGLAPAPLHVQPLGLSGNVRHLGRVARPRCRTIRRVSSKSSRELRTVARSTT